jgi:hypothetical protein
MPAMIESGKEYVSYSQVLDALGISPNDKYPHFNPQSPEKVEEVRSRLSLLTKDPEEIEMIMAVARAGEFAIMASLYRI